MRKVLINYYRIYLRGEIDISKIKKSPLLTALLVLTSLSMLLIPALPLAHARPWLFEGDLDPYTGHAYYLDYLLWGSTVYAEVWWTQNHYIVIGLVDFDDFEWFILYPYWGGDSGYTYQEMDVPYSSHWGFYILNLSNDTIHYIAYVDVDYGRKMHSTGLQSAFLICPEREVD